MKDYFEIGKIIGTHGIKGTLRIFPTTDDVKRFSLLRELLVLQGEKQSVYHVEKINYHKQYVLIKTEEINTIEEAEKLKNALIIIPEELALPLEENEYYTRDLYGLEVYTLEGEYLGILENVYVTGANDVYGIKKSDEKKELLLPAIKQCIKKVDLKEKKMTVTILEGLR